MSLEIKNISKKYGNQEALSNISFSLNKGDIVGFLGPNGAGKTTLMKIITSTLKQDSGEVTVFGKSTISEEIETKSVIGYLAEHNPLYKEMNVIEYLQFIASLYKIKDFNIIENIISKTGLKMKKQKKLKLYLKGISKELE